MFKELRWHFDSSKQSPVQYLDYISKELDDLHTIPIADIKQLSESLLSVRKCVVEQTEYEKLLQSESALNRELQITKTVLDSAKESIVKLLGFLADSRREIVRLTTYVYVLRSRNASRQRNSDRSHSPSRSGR